MSFERPVDLDREEIDTLLGDGGVGVIAFADEDEPYSIPVSYGYDGDAAGLYVRLGFAPESEKRRFVDEGRTASLVVTDETPAGWQSVVAKGPLSEVTEMAIDPEAAKSVHKVRIPFVTIYDREPSELEFELYRLEAETVTGRREA